MPNSFMRAHLFLLIMMSSYCIKAQTYLVFDKPGIVKRVRFYEGETITFKSSSTSNFVTDEIIALNKPYLILAEMGSVHEDSITHFAFGNQNGFAKFRFALSGILITSGIGYFIIDSFNNGINNNEVFDEKTIFTSIPMISLGFLIKPWSKRKFKVGNNRRLYIIDMDSGLNKES